MINKRAKIKRQLKWIKIFLFERYNTRKNNNYGYNVVLLVVIFLLPIYPSLAGNSQIEFYRGYIDESSIIGSYYGGYENNDDSILLESKDSFLSINTYLDEDRDLSGTNEITEYEVKDGDSISVIAYNFGVSNSSIYWANDFTKNHIIHPGDKIKIPPVSGVIYKVKLGDTISKIASEYNISEENIKRQNILDDTMIISVGDVLVIPGAVKKQDIVVKKDTSTKTKSKAKNFDSKDYSFSKFANSQIVTTKGSYELVWRKPQHSFYWGNCTWYVSQYKNVNWGGNANKWLANAKALGHATGSSPDIGAIIVFNGRGYNPKYGHVGIVMEVKSDSIIVSDMNYRKLGEVTYRSVPLNDRSIIGYIYVD